MATLTPVQQVKKHVQPAPKGQQWVFLFDEFDLVEKAIGTDPEEARALLGGKGANLAEMTRIGLPVPPGFTITTRACNAYLAANNAFPDGLWEQALRAVSELEKKIGKCFGQPSNPLLVSVRSGAKFSMPGMMDTILNLGMNDAIAEGMVAQTGDPRFIYDSYRRLIQMFGTVVMNIKDEAFEDYLTEIKATRGVTSDVQLTAEDWKQVTAEFKRVFREAVGHDFPENPLDQLRAAIEAVFGSWNGKRAIDYRNAAHIAHDLGTAVNVQAMVFGNTGETSGTGVAFTRNPSTGVPILFGDYLMNAQGEDVVAGIRTPIPIDKLAAEN